MSSTASLLYAFDPLCGWCYGFIPAMEALSRALPRLTIELGFGGLVTGARIRPYAESRGYIEGASERLFAVTKQKVRPAFFERVLGNSAVVASSIPPCAALLQVRAHAPDRVLELAHALQRAHFEHGEDLNDPALYTRGAGDIAAAQARLSAAEAEVARLYARWEALLAKG
jgi:putative protein-disulfide isomerase